MKLLALIFIFADILHILSADDANCPRGYFYQGDLDICLTYSTAAATWTGAARQCRNSGGNLISIHNAFQNSLVAQISMNLTGETRSWLGAQNDSNQVWTWADGTLFDYQRFVRSSEAGNCAYLDHQDMMWKVTSCTKSYKYLCATPRVSFTGSPTPFDGDSTPIALSTVSGSDLTCLPALQQPLYNCRVGWQFFPDTGYEYLVIYDQNHTTAEAYCVSQSAHLASIHSAAENDFVAGLCCTSGCQFGHSGDYYGAYIVGGHRIQSFGEHLVWTDGTPFDYQHKSCVDDQIDGDYLTLLNTGCFENDCSVPGVWDWNVVFLSDILPYAVCKRKSS